MLKPFREIYRYRKTIGATTLYDIRKKYAGSVVGLGWHLLYPAVFLGLYALVYLAVFEVRLPRFSSGEYVLAVFCGLIPFLSFAEALGRGVHTVTAHRDLISNTLFPIEFMAVDIVLASQVPLLVGFTLLAAALSATGHGGMSYVLLLPVLAVQTLFTVGAVWVLAAVNVFVRDLGHLVGIVVLMLMMASPIAYTEEMIPEPLRPLLYLNPLYYPIVLYRKIFLFDTFDWGLFAVFAVISLLQFVGGYHFFVRLKRLFHEYL